MRAFILQRLLLLPVVLMFVAVFVFSLIRLVPGDPALVMLGDQAYPADVAALHAALGLDTPGPIEFVRWFGSALRGDLGQSLFFHTPVLQLILSRLEPTFLLTTYAMIVSIAIGIPLGTIAALRRGRIADRLISILSLFGISAPSFLVGLLLILVVAVNLRVLPSGGYHQLSEGLLPNIRSLMLPTIALSLAQVTLVIRMTRSAVLEVLGADFIRVAQAKGLPPPECDLSTRIEERDDLDRDGRRPQFRRAGRRCGRDGDVVQPAWDRTARGELCLPPRLSRHPGRRPVYHLRGDRRQPSGRRPLRVDRSAHPILVTGAVSRRDIPSSRASSSTRGSIRASGSRDGPAVASNTSKRARGIHLGAILEDRAMFAGAAIVMFFTIVAIAGVWIAPHDALQPFAGHRLSPPSREFPFGTDDFSRDVFSRVIVATRTSMLIGVSVATLTFVVGGAFGLVAGYYRFVDRVLMRLYRCADRVSRRSCWRSRLPRLLAPVSARSCSRCRWCTHLMRSA